MKKQLQKFKKNRKGFTLVELIIVIAIIAILALVLAPQYIKYVEKSRWANDQNNANTLLNEVQNAIVATQDDGKTVKGGSIVLKKGAMTYVSDDTDFNAAMTEADANWTTIELKNKSNDTGKQTYTITYTPTSAKGEWDK